MMVFASFPFLECRQFLGDGGEKANNDPDGRGFHIVAELADNFLILSRSAKLGRGVENGISLQGSGNGNRIASPPTPRARLRPP